MGEKIYQVLYIDKFADAIEAATTSQSLRKLFGLDEKAIARLASGKPTVVKKNVPYAAANRLHEAICEAGGTCWVEEVGDRQAYGDRREEMRRQLFDRRCAYRGSAIVPDRRKSCGRRSSDEYWHK